MVFPEYGDGWRCKLVLPPLLDGDRLNVAQLAVADPDGNERRSRMPPAAFLQMVAATNFKQRTRMTMAYYHADRLNFAVAGHPELRRVRPGLLREAGRRGGRLQADRPPLQDPGLSRSPRYLGMPAEIQERPPTTDTYSLAQTQEEFYFALPYREMDLCLWAVDHGVPGRRGRTRHRAHRGPGRAGLPRHRGEATREPLPPRTCRRRSSHP